MLPRRAALLILSLGVLALPACKSAERLFAGLDKPQVNVTGVRFDKLSAEGLLLNFDAEVSNPYAVPLPLTDISYKLASGGPPFIDGAASLGGSAGFGTIPANGKKTVTLPVGVRFAPLMERVAAAKPGGVIPYDANLTFKVDAPGVGPLELPVKKSGQIPIPAVPEISVTNVKWDELGLTGAKGEIRLKVKNTNQFNVDLNQLAYALSLGGREVASSRVAQPAKFTPGGEQEIRIPINLSALQAGMGILDILGGSKAGYLLKGETDLGTPFGPVKLPFERTGTTALLR